MSIKVRLLDESDQVLVRRLRIQHYKGSFETPTYMVETRDLDGMVISEKEIGGVVELTLQIKLDNLERLNDTRYQSKLEYEIQRRINKIPEDRLVLLVPLVQGKSDEQPSPSEAKKHMSLLSEVIFHPLVDITCLPTFQRINEGYVEEFISEFLSYLSIYKKYSIPVIPPLSRPLRNSLVKKYTEYFGKTNYLLPQLVCVDYNGSNPITKYILQNYIIKYIKYIENEYKHPVAVIGVNVKYGKIGSRYEKLAARDLASYFALLDIQGRNHKRQPLPPQAWSSASKTPLLKRIKIININKYIYLSLQEALPNHTLLPDIISSLLREGEAERNERRLEKLATLFNSKEFLKEANRIRRVLKEGSEPAEYLKNKEAIKIDDVILKNIRKLASQYRSKGFFN